ncbi:MAG TPA: metallophosphoesterase family protein [Myxococcaceae bacterium]|nr:metallophosphoesterase family protein [Myxococcaceae bacterium]
MRVAILADIHGNLPACEAVLEDIDRMAPDFIVAAGDLALRGAHPRETVELLLDRCDSVLMGNTDCYLAGNYLGGAYRERDHWKTELLRWTRDQLGEAHLRTLGALPFSVRYTPRKGQDLFVCHANPKNLEESLDPTLDEVSVRRFFMHLDAAACAFGHLHFPYRRRVGRMLIADVASAGIPRDGDLRPAYGIFTYTPKGWRVQIRRVRYPVRKATQALTARKVPGGPILIHKLVEARYRHHHALLEAARRHSGLPPPGPVLRPPPGAPPRPAAVDVPAVETEPPVPRHDELEAATLRQEEVDPRELPPVPEAELADEAPIAAAQMGAVVNDLDG